MNGGKNVQENTDEFDRSWTLSFVAALMMCSGGLLVAVVNSDMVMGLFMAAGILFFSERLVYEASVSGKVQQGGQEKEEIPKYEWSDIAIFLRILMGMVFLDVASVFLWIASCCFSWTPLTSMELHTAYYRASYDKEHGEGSADMVVSFYETYLRPDIETDENGIEWVRT
jgi:hypothetical protein